MISQAAIAIGVILLAAGVLSPAAAGAWTREAGDTLLLSEVRFGLAGARFDEAGNAISDSYTEFYDAELWIEHGWQDGLTLVGKGLLREIYIEGEGGDGRSQIEIGGGGRLQLIRWGPVAVAAEPWTYVAHNFDRFGPSKGEVTSIDGEGRVLAGVTLPWAFFARRYAFAEVQAGYRVRGGPADDILKSQGLVGVPVLPFVYGYLKQWSEWEQGGTDLTRSALHGGSLSFHVLPWPELTVEVGAFAVFAGRNAIRERGLMATVWTSF